ncbi:hypothetical protein EI94DRAFT_1803130 [Lactarius quietus]|nr:hypothetical protein EI94DRAFT_1803130 [Lactarius quietus]
MVAWWSSVAKAALEVIFLVQLSHALPKPKAALSLRFRRHPWLNTYGTILLGKCRHRFKLSTFLVVYFTQALASFTGSSFLTHGATVTLVVFIAGAVAALFWTLLCIIPIAIQVVESDAPSSLAVCSPPPMPSLADRHVARHFHFFTVIFMAITTYVSLDVEHVGTWKPSPYFFSPPSYSHLYDAARAFSSFLPCVITET